MNYQNKDNNEKLQSMENTSDSVEMNNIHKQLEDFHNSIKSNEATLQKIIKSTELNKITEDESIDIIKKLNPFLEKYIDFYASIVERIMSVNATLGVKWLVILQSFSVILTPIIKNLNALSKKFGILLTFNNSLRTIIIASILNPFFSNQIMNTNANGPDFISIEKKQTSWISEDSKEMTLEDLNKWFTVVNKVLKDESKMQELDKLLPSQKPKLVLSNIEYKLKREGYTTFNAISKSKIEVSEKYNATNFSDWKGLSICFWGFSEKEGYKCFLTKNDATLNSIKKLVQTKRDIFTTIKRYINQNKFKNTRMSKKMKTLNIRDINSFCLLDTYPCEWIYKSVDEDHFYDNIWEVTKKRSALEIMKLLYKINTNEAKYLLINYLSDWWFAFEDAFNEISRRYAYYINTIKDDKKIQEAEKEFNEFKTEYYEKVRLFFNYFVDDKLITKEIIDDLYTNKRYSLIDPTYAKSIYRLKENGNIDNYDNENYYEDSLPKEDVNQQNQNNKKR